MKLTTCLTSLLLLLSTSLLTMPDAYAERVEPTGRDTPVIATFDKSSPPAQLDIWKDESGGYDSDNDSLWGRNTWVCLSSSNPIYGQCKTTVTGVEEGNTLIPILFTEQRSHMTQVINLTGYHKISVSVGNGCWAAGIIGGPYQVYAAMEKNCGGVKHNDESLLTVYVTSQELQKLPTGGIWEANLKMNLMQWSPAAKLADWNARITLNVTDNNNQQIYLPEFGQAAPLVNLNMRPLPGNGINKISVIGSASIDVCLYDGYNANSSAFMLTINDNYTGQGNRTMMDFSLVREGGNASNDRDRIDYVVDILNPDTNTIQTVARGTQMTFTKIQQAHIRQVHLPGLPQPVICVPAPLTLSTQMFEINSKNAGGYRGTLELNFTPSLY
ncbi:CfaE/CblD family pilus tip adhesin [Rahnella sp. CFA14(1/10)]|uniref:CfaE/CblD family pilus tip adhesin n=1 Tax=Rahnella sp. CFA14(1/10) TaxID=2511203 RepID=UPI00101EC715|nr:CfaE/CblD family pilus tip adhesin [Rahnella sp. CFA14(1/10)]